MFQGDRKKPGELCGSRTFFGIAAKSRIPLQNAFPALGKPSGWYGYWRKLPMEMYGSPKRAPKQLGLSREGRLWPGGSFKVVKEVAGSSPV